MIILLRVVLNSAYSLYEFTVPLFLANPVGFINGKFAI